MLSWFLCFTVASDISRLELAAAAQRQPILSLHKQTNRMMLRTKCLVAA
jgi:hypothetical protein